MKKARVLAKFFSSFEIFFRTWKIDLKFFQNLRFFSQERDFLKRFGRILTFSWKKTAFQQKNFQVLRFFSEHEKSIWKIFKTWHFFSRTRSFTWHGSDIRSEVLKIKARFTFWILKKSQKVPKLRLDLRYELLKNLKKCRN